MLFDAAVAARNRTPNADICIPEIGVYGTYEEAEKTVIVCHVCYHFYYGCDGTEHYTDSGAMQAPAKAVLEVSDDMLHCVSFELVPNGAGTNVWAKEFCGPLTDLASYFLSPEQDEEWPLENTMPSSEQLFREFTISNKESPQNEAYYKPKICAPYPMTSAIPAMIYSAQGSAMAFPSAA